jgi:hypothetical protein
VFQKILRDVAILSVFDGNTLVNLSNVAIHSRALERGESLPPPEAAFRLFDSTPEFDPGRLGVLASRAAGAEALARHARARLAGAAHADSLGPMLERLAVEASSVRHEMARVVPGAPSAMTARVVELSSRYADLAACALAACVFVHAERLVSGVLCGGDWLVLLLARVLHLELPPRLAGECRERLLTFAFAAVDARTSLSILLDRPQSEESP